MKLISEYLGHNLEIVTPSFFKSEFNLVANGIIISKLKSVKFWGGLYEINAYEKVWEIYSASVWSGKTEIKEKEKQLPLAYYEASGLKHDGTFFLPQGETVKLVFNLWKSFYELQKENGDVLVHYKNKSMFSSIVIVTMNKKSELIDKYPFLMMFPYYISRQRQQAAAAVTH